MPKLSKAAAKKVDEAESSFDLLDDGVYHVRLRQVTVSENPGPSGAHYWSWEFEVIEEPYIGRRLWNNTSLSDAAAFKLKEAYDAFDAEVGSDTDEILGDACRAVVSTRVIQQGARKGENANQIDRLTQADPDFEVPESEASGAVKGDDGEDLF